MLKFSRQELQEISEIIDSTQNFVVTGLRANKNKVFAINLMRTIHSKIDSQATKILKNLPQKPDCKRGCNHCCSLRVDVMPPEVFLIANELRKRPKLELAQIIDELKLYAATAKNLTIGEHRITCPLLKNGECSVYEIRPAMCRKFFSMNVEQCKSYITEEPEEICLKTTGIILGARGGYKKSKMIDLNAELGQALLIALTDEKAEEKWLRGQQVFLLLPEEGYMAQESA